MNEGTLIIVRHIDPDADAGCGKENAVHLFVNSLSIGDMSFEVHCDD